MRSEAMVGDLAYAKLLRKLGIFTHLASRLVRHFLEIRFHGGSIASSIL